MSVTAGGEVSATAGGEGSATVRATRPRRADPGVLWRGRPGRRSGEPGERGRG
ncbi:hypothetical protein WME99_15895 [Sorangium sp. So ce136]|uniref:hypothetical protein n=1 Tax=Sorangium sp. So ce136 TaxID=3133284 RepID=UPI003EFC39B2